MGVALLAATGGCQTKIHEPRNLAEVKKELRVYAESEYPQHIDAVVSDLIAWLDSRSRTAKINERLMLVLDLDETLLSNQGYFDLVDWGYTSETWRDWDLKGEAKAIEPVTRAFKEARKRGIVVAIITGRRENTSPGAIKNLKAIGCSDYETLIFRPNNDKGSVAPFKINERRKLQESGFTIIANVGDQESDLVGGFAERTFKLPDPFYFVP